MSDKATAAAKGLTTKHIVLILGALVIICAAVITTVLLLRDKPAQSGTPVINESNLTNITGEIKEKVAKGMFQTHMNTTWIFPDGKSASSNAVMGNAASNNYPFWFTVKLSETGEIIYKSSLLPVGTQLAKIKLEKNLPKGTYPAVVNIHMIDENGAEVESNMGINLKIVVEK